MKNLIFIEGVSGVGKSTVTKKLCDTLNRHGFSATCYLEGNPNNPVDLFGCAFLLKEAFDRLLKSFPNNADALMHNSIHEKDYVLVQYRSSDAAYFPSPLSEALERHEGFYMSSQLVPLERYTQVYVDCWHRFLQQNETAVDSVIFDGSFLYHRMNDLVHNYNARNKSIAAFLISLLSAMQPHEPLLFYLFSNDVVVRLIQARKSRRQTPATEARILFEVEKHKRQMQILELLPIKAERFDITHGNWATAIEIMMRIIAER
ncbi:MAG: hypothetical protein FWD25_10225 [Clostridia bacterium]|nr:hypothetical protein [Clostridia bacterium]